MYSIPIYHGIWYFYKAERACQRIGQNIQRMGIQA